MMDGDRAKWVVHDAPDCSSDYEVTRAVGIYNAAGSSGDATFFFGDDYANAVLCYKWKYMKQPSEKPLAGQEDTEWVEDGVWVAATGFILLRDVKLALISYKEVLPRATAIGCASRLTVHGGGFTGTGDTAIFGSPTCNFIGVGSSPATVVDDNTVTCTTPIPAAVSTYSMRLDYGAYTKMHPDHFAFQTFDMANSYITSLYPEAGMYSTQATIEIEGTFEDFGVPRCACHTSATLPT